MFENSSIPNKESVVNSILNLGLLPKNENISKSKKRLIEVTDEWLKNQIEKYEFVTQEQYSTYSDITNYKNIFEARFEIFKDAFDTKRTYILNN